MGYWLVKSEPSVYSIDDLRRDKKTYWEGVRNYGARNNLRSMKKGDRVFFYHSNAEPSAVVGIGKIVREAYPDPDQFDKGSHYFDPKSKKEDPRWSVVDIAFEERLKKPVSLQQIKAAARLKNMDLVRQGRLSVGKVSSEEWNFILRLGS